MKKGHFRKLPSEKSNMKKILFVLGLLPLAVTAPDKGKAFKLSGKTSHLAYKVDWVYLQYRTNDEWKTDSMQAKDGKYEFTGTVSEPTQARLRARYAPGADGNKIITVAGRDISFVFLQAGKIKVTSVDSFSNIHVKGSEAHTEYAKLNEQSKPFEERIKP